MADPSDSSTCPGLVMAKGDDIVTWQTAFWIIIPIALNSMLQNNGMVLSFPSTWGLALRSSPMFCLFDALELTITWLAFMLLNAESPVSAARRVARLRFRDVPSEESEQSLPSLQKHIWIIQIVFVITVLTQAIKLFGMRGIMGTQICAACYLYSWTISQILLLAAGSGWKAEDLPVASEGETTTYLEKDGLPLRSSLHVMAVYFHCLWVDGLFEEMSMRNSISFSNAPLPAFGFCFLIILVYVVFPLVIYFSDLTSLIKLPSQKLWVLRLIIPFCFAISKGWNMFVRHTILQEPFADSVLFGISYLVLLGDMARCAFDQESRADMMSLIPGAYGICLLVDWVLWFGLKNDILDILFGILLTLVFGYMGFARGLVKRITLRMQSQLGQRISSSHWNVVLGLLMMIYPLFDMDMMLALVIVCLVLYNVLFVVKQGSGHGEMLFSSAVAGACFVGMNAIAALLWYWQYWPNFWPACTVKPAWTSVPFG